MVLKGHKVDIVTSNPILTKRDAEESEEIYKKFDITVGNNIEDGANLFNSYEKQCYTKDVVYGTTFEYQADILRDEYELINVRNKRPFDIVIVDEIDSMLIDEYARKTQLSSSKPFLEKYTIFLQLIWAYYKNLHLKDKEVINDQEMIDKLKQYLSDKIKKIINSNDKKSTFYFPLNHSAKKFALDQVEKWVNSLIQSLYMKKNVEYIIDKNQEIVPVDQDNTGVFQKKTTLSYGLHQFLQINNNLPVTPISVLTYYLSNFQIFIKYFIKNFLFL